MAASLPFVEISPDGTNFVLHGADTVFHPHGFNYDRDYKLRLIEEYWDSEWSTVAEDFQEMKQLGANVVRIHLQLAKFLDSPTKANRRSIAKLKKLLQLAEETGLYLDITGLSCYRKADVPAWFEKLNEQQRWEAQASFWKAVAKACAKSPSVFCYDLINEPIVPAQKRTDWLVAELAGFYYVQAIALDPDDRERSAIAVSWTKTMCEAIRRYDRKHMITIGLLPDSADSPSSSGFEPRKLAPLLDFISVHVYPNSKHLRADLATVRKFAVGKPLVIEETFPMTCSISELNQFLLDAQPPANGWISFYWGETPRELKNSKSIAASILLEWLKTAFTVAHFLPGTGSK